ncbi:hypothetical protein MLO22_25140, partial [Escherichia coli]|nr:hypothetical protein [Escherichia coli]
MTYYFVSPFSHKNNGISNYVASAYHLLLENGIDAQIIRNDERLSPKQLEDKINSIATENDIVELPDA